MGYSLKVRISLSLSLSLSHTHTHTHMGKVWYLVLVYLFIVCVHWGCTYSGTCLLGFWCYVRRICYGWALLKLQDLAVLANFCLDYLGASHFSFLKLWCFFFGFLVLKLDVWVSLAPVISHLKIGICVDLPMQLCFNWYNFLLNYFINIS